MNWIFLLILLLNSLDLSKSSLDTQGEIQELKSRLSKLEKMVEELEPTFVERYGLIKRCTVPPVENGFAQCDNTKDIKPKTKCRVVCNAGYIATPGFDETRCMEGGHWSIDMKCEIPLVVISGGEISDSIGDSTVEVIDFEGVQGCNVDIPDMPSQRRFHNLLYHPAEAGILACNGLNTTGSATCDVWKMRGHGQSWTKHSQPNRGSSLDEAKHRVYSSSSYKSMVYVDPNPHKSYGRYAAESVTINNNPVIYGGMVNKGDSHQVTNTARVFGGFDWIGYKAGTKRAFFCAVKLQEGLVVTTGGFGVGQKVLKSVSPRTSGAREYTAPLERRNYTDMPLPLSGHGCTVLPNSYDILVAGGSRNERDDSQLGSYIYSWTGNAWNNTADMNIARFGHKLVTVGQNVFAIGGKQRNHDVYLDSIEIFDTDKREWNNFGQSLKKPRAHFGLALVPRSIFYGCQIFS